MTEQRWPLHEENAKKYAEYIADRNRLIPFAEKKADLMVGPDKRSAASRKKRDLIYLAEMDRLARLHGVVR